MDLGSVAGDDEVFHARMGRVGLEVGSLRIGEMVEVYLIRVRFLTLLTTSCRLVLGGG